MTEEEAKLFGILDLDENAALLENRTRFDQNSLDWKEM